MSAATADPPSRAAVPAGGARARVTTRSTSRRIVVTLATLIGGLFVVVVVNSLHWIGRPFPGFLVMENRVIASAALGEWLDVDRAHLFQHQVIAVDGQPAADAAGIYAAVRARPAGTQFTYLLRSVDGERRTVTVPSRRFSGWDHVQLFGAYLLAGVAFVATGLVVFLLNPSAATAQALLSCGLAIGVFALTGVDLYGPSWFFRLHVVGETFASIGLLHLALVFPIERLRGQRGRVLAALYGLGLIFALAYELGLSAPSAYTRLHLWAAAGQGIGAVWLVASVIWGFFRSGSPLVRRRIGIVAIGTVAGFLLPGLLIGASAIVGGSVPVNLSAFTVFIFPLSVGYAVLKRDLFEIDEIIRLAIGYALVFLTLGIAYLGGMVLLGKLIPDNELLTRSPVLFATLNLLMVFAVVPVRTRIQRALDHAFSRHTYDGQEALSELGSALATARGVPAIVGAVGRSIVTTLDPLSFAMLLRDGAGPLQVQTAEGPGGNAPAFPAEIMGRLEHGESLARYEWDDGSGAPIPPIWDALRAELIVPILDARGLVGLLALGRRRSGGIFTGGDLAFLRALVKQVALAIEDARLLLEVERQQASLIRADRLATLGRLSSGIAHEINNPLGAVLNSLGVLSELGREYAASIDDPGVGPDDHREIAQEILTNTEKAAQWATRARDYLKGITTQARDARKKPSQSFAVAGVVSHIHSLLSFRLNASACSLEFAEETAGITVFGDPGPLGQVLVNLVTNALDAYEDSGRSERRILIQARQDSSAVSITVADWAGGIPEEILPRIFDELYTTKEAGRGTGLGLWISRNLIEEMFSGSLVASVRPGEGTTFTVTLPNVAAAARDALPPAAA
jgi:signal transduction histidine kinase